MVTEGTGDVGSDSCRRIRGALVEGASRDAEQRPRCTFPVFTKEKSRRLHLRLPAELPYELRGSPAAPRKRASPLDQIPLLSPPLEIHELVYGYPLQRERRAGENGRPVRRDDSLP